ncbi:TPA: ATPase [Vibrio parahaemolyticus]|uniref:ATPase n=1 Tax=Vibrio atypicus TaxID=558271 RepID=UPI001A255709|nr:ATPase [Vibrio parahaemolyticus]MDG2604310.1 ATPase [Vibrio parahaemolyticus]HAS6610626.1 ATPase [Vibrio parahaemolyticus]HAS6621237.1 ATPase [Vibrio parahaemolyticus]HAS6631771.1 ATPase [Vibrio parahaemolyticus]
MSETTSQKYCLVDELNKTVTKSLVTTFGLDFLLFEDKKGGDVATIHNVRQHQKGDKDIFMSNSVQQDYVNRGDYKPIKHDESGNVLTHRNGKPKKEDLYHSDKNYLAKGKEDKRLQRDGKLVDEYRGTTMSSSEQRQLDHIISSHEVHDDAGRVLAGLSGVELANQRSNFQSTHSYINNLKSDHSMDDFLTTVVPRTIENKRQRIEENKQRLASMPTGTKEQRHKKRELESKIAKENEHIEVLESLDEDKMRAADKRARQAYDKQINFSYYTSSKFFKSTAMESGKAGLKMGVRQALGLVLAEVWFELKDAIPQAFKDTEDNFTLENFLEKLKNTSLNIWHRVKVRFKDILQEFSHGVLAGALSSLSTTIMNIFFTTQKLIGKLLRETWSSLVSAAKVLFFNPEHLGPSALAREVTRILSTGVAVAMGVMLNQQLATLMTFPLGTELASFVSAVATGLMTIGITYFLDHSQLMKKVWEYLDQFKSETKKTLEYFQKVNAEIDRYLIELSKVEFNLSPEELTRFTTSLESICCESERSYMLSQEIRKREIDLPFESNNLDSTRAWLMKL